MGKISLPIHNWDTRETPAARRDAPGNITEPHESNCRFQTPSPAGIAASPLHPIYSSSFQLNADSDQGKDKVRLVSKPNPGAKE